MSTNYEIDYNDKRFEDVEAEKNTALGNINSTYDNMVNQADQFYQEQINASKEWADKQAQLQQEKTDFAIDQIEQQKEQTRKDYIREQSGAYVDWQKQSNQYGANAEVMAAQGMAGTGYSESSQVSMYNTYQNRVATARDSYNRAITNYNNAITEARLQNNSALAEIAYTALQQQLELSLQGFQYKNQLVLDKASTQLQVDNMYYARYQDVLAQINHENALAEQIRQFNLSLDAEKQKYGNSYQIEKETDKDVGKDIDILPEQESAVSFDPTGKPSLNTNVPVDIESVVALGLGQVNADELAALVSSGVVDAYVEDGMLKFRKTGIKGASKPSRNPDMRYGMIGVDATLMENQKG
jgi:hypothetical protein